MQVIFGVGTATVYTLDYKSQSVWPARRPAPLVVESGSGESEPESESLKTGLESNSSPSPESEYYYNSVNQLTINLT
jgi:hypothetical protein